MEYGTFRLGIIVLAHRDPEQLATLLNTLRHPQVRLYLHVDSKVPIAPFNEAFERAGVEDITWLKRRRTRWGTLDTVEAELEGISLCLTDGCDYVIVISGLDFPLRPIAEIVRFFSENRERTYLEALPIPSERWGFGGRDRIEFYAYRLPGAVLTCVPYGEDTSTMSRRRRPVNWALRLWTVFRPKRKFPSYADPFGGSHWFNLSSAAAAYLLEFVEAHPDYRQYHKDTVCVDEIFVHSILRSTQFAETHEIVNDDLRYVVWEDLGLRGTPHPNVLTLDDLPDMVSSGALFARKVSSTEQPELFAELLEIVRSDERNGNELAS
jgi:hypothetical protein